MPNFAEAWMARGAVKHHVKDKIGATEDLRRALELKPELAQQLEGEATVI
jgi:hypothetical protein